MAERSSRRDRRAAWRGLRPFMEGGAIDLRRKAYHASAEALAVRADTGLLGFSDTYDVAFGRLLNDPARPKHAARTAQWRAMWPAPAPTFVGRSLR